MSVPARYFDGRSTRVREVSLSLADGELLISGADVHLEIPFSHVVVDERLGSAPRRLRLPDGAICEVTDQEALAQLLAATGHRDGRVDRLQRQAQGVLLALVIFIAVAWAAYRWALPWAAAEGASRIPIGIAHSISSQVLRSLDADLLKPSRMAASRQRALSLQFATLQQRDDRATPSSLVFRASPHLGANAFTLPDGTIVLLDELAAAIPDDAQVLAVLAHERGHAEERHGLQMLLRSSVVGAFLTLYLGDISQLLAAAPAALIEARYSQAFESQADEDGARLLRTDGRSPGLLADALTRLSTLKPGSDGGGYLSSHPPTDARIRRLRALAAATPQPEPRR